MIYEAFLNFIESDKVKLEWDLLNDVPDEDLNPGFFKVLINIMIFTRECLIRGGTITVKKDGLSMIVEAKGETVMVREGMAEALRQELAVADLTPKTVHAYVTGAYSHFFNCPIELNQGEGVLTVKMSYTPADKIEEPIEEQPAA